MSHKQALPRRQESVSQSLFSEGNTVPLPDMFEQENPWGDPGQQRGEENGPPSPPEPSAQHNPRHQNDTADDNDVQPPMYSGPSNPPPASPNTQPPSLLVPGLPPLSFASYAPPGSAQSRDAASVRINNPKWCSSLESFTRAVYEQIALPPRPEVHIVGNPGEWGQPTRGFDIRLNMTRYFLPRDGQNGLSYVKARALPSSPSTADVGLQESIQAFFADPSRPKSSVVPSKHPPTQRIPN
jgi:hypothetical protein